MPVDDQIAELLSALRGALDADGPMTPSPDQRDEILVLLDRLRAGLDPGARDLRASAMFLESIVENIPDMVFVKDADELRFVRFNRAGEELLGYSREEMLGKNDYDFFPKEEADFFTGKDREVLAGDAVVDIAEEPIHTRLHGLRYLHTKKIPIVGDDGTPLYLLGISHDITEQKAAREELARRTDELAGANAELQVTERRLRDRETQLQVLLEHFPGALWTVDASGRLTSAAGARAAALGLQPRTDDDEPITVSRDSVGRQAFEAHRAALEGRTANYELHTGRHTYEVQVEPLRYGDRPGAIGVALDVTERRKLEAERVQERSARTQQLEVLGLLAGGIAHDFNNLLASIMGNAGLALLKLPEDSPTRPIITRIEATAERAAELTRQLLAYSGKGSFVVERVDLSHVVEEMSELLRVSLPKKITLRFELDQCLPTTMADSAQVRQLVMNLITNAGDAIGEAEGSITLSTSPVDADREYLDTSWPMYDLDEGAYVVLQVVDTGCGMDDATQARMFEPFFTTKAKGHGLGMAAILGIVRAHRGAIHVQSEVGEGTAVTVLFGTIDGERAQASDPGPEPESTSTHGTLLVVDDEEDVRTFVAETLGEAGFEIVLAADGREAVELFRERHAEIDGVFLDLMMPRMNGDEALREFRRIRSDVPVLLTSGYSEVSASGESAEGGEVGFLQKPYRVHELITRVRELLRLDD